MLKSANSQKYYYPRLRNSCLKNIKYYQFQLFSLSMIPNSSKIDFNLSEPEILYLFTSLSGLKDCIVRLKIGKVRRIILIR